MAFGHAPGDSVAEHVDLIRTSEDLGFSTAWIADQTMHRDPYAVLAMAGVATRRVRLGIGVTNPFTRHPAMTARAIATVSELAGGRTVLGFGAGNRRELLDPLGLHVQDVPGYMRDAIRICRGLLVDGHIDYQGTYLHAREMEMDFRPQHPIPICIAGRGRRTLELAGELADGAIIGGLSTPGGVAYALEAIDRGCRASGRAREEVQLHSWVTCVVSDDPAADKAKAAPMVAHIIGGAPQELFQYLEIPAADVAAVRQAYRAGGTARAVPEVTDACIDAFAIVGPVETCRERIGQLVRAGISEVVALLPAADCRSHQASLTRLAPLGESRSQRSASVL